MKFLKKINAACPLITLHIDDLNFILYSFSSSKLRCSFTLTSSSNNDFLYGQQQHALTASCFCLNVTNKLVNDMKDLGYYCIRPQQQQQKQINKQKPSIEFWMYSVLNHLKMQDTYFVTKRPFSSCPNLVLETRAIVISFILWNFWSYFGLLFTVSVWKIRKYPELSIYTTVFNTDMKKHDHVLWHVHVSPHVRQSKSILDYEFRAVDSGFQVLDSGFSRTWIQDSNC